MTIANKPVLFTERYGAALAFAERLHRDQYRKGANIPYVSHLLSVSALVIENGGDEDEAIAGLLHDSIEDQAGPDPEPLMREIRGMFGDRVLEIVIGCSDSETSVGKPPWRARKERYLEHVRTASKSVVLVSAADKVHNARSILADYLSEGEVVWRRFTGGKDGSLWYYRALADAFAERVPDVPARLSRLLTVTVEEIETLARS